MKYVYYILLFVVNINLLHSQEDHDSRILELISKMTIEEKIIQLQSEHPNGVPRLNIPNYLWHNECLHGIGYPNITIFPQAIGLAAMFDTSYVRIVSSAITDEGRILYNQGKVGLNYWAPNLNIFRDPRWGRGQETYGEDPFLTARTAVAFIRGMQGEDDYYLKTIATPKHFAVHSGPEKTRLSFNAVCSMRDLHETYLPAFKAAVMEGKAYSIMTAYNAINGIPNSINTYLLNDIVKDKWGFEGYLTGDCFAVECMYYKHNLVPNVIDGVSKALLAGVCMDCGDGFYKSLDDALEQNLIKEKDIDSAVFKVLKARFKLGLFDEPNKSPYNNIPDSLLNSRTFRDISLEAAKKSIVLLKNQNNILPLKKDSLKIFLVGPNANSLSGIVGNYVGWNWDIVTIENGIRDKINSSAKVDFELGCFYYCSDFTKDLKPYFKTNFGQPGLIGEYFSNSELTGEPVFSRLDTSISFYWNNGFPDERLDSNNFSVRWEGKLTVPSTQVYTFLLASDDGAIVVINGDTIISDWNHGGFRYVEKSKELVADEEYDIEIAYQEKDNYSAIDFGFAPQIPIDSMQIFHIISKAKESDVIIFVGGNTSIYESETLEFEYEGFDSGDRTKIEPPRVQDTIISYLKQAGKPIVLVEVGGSALAMDYAVQAADAVLMAWYPGMEGGRAVADVLFGDYSPAGKLPVTFYQSTDDLPDFSDYSMENRTYRYYKKDVLFPFGFGLSYTNFEYTNIVLNKHNFDFCDKDSIIINYHTANIGDFDSDDVLQVYVANLDSKMTQPIKQLKGFNRINIIKGEEKTAQIKVPTSELFSFDEIIGDYIYEEGRYEIQLGRDSKDIIFRDTILMTNCKASKIDFYDNEFILAYPNPASDDVFIELKNFPIDNYVILLYNINGNRINTKISNVSNNLFKLNLKGISEGTYYISFENNSKRLVKKITILR